MYEFIKYGLSLVICLLIIYFAVRFTKDINQISNNIAKLVYIFNLQVAEVEETK